MTETNKQIIGRLESLKRSFQSARDTDFSGKPEVRFIEGIRAGLKVAIEGIDSEIRMIRAGEKALEPTTDDKE